MNEPVKLPKDCIERLEASERSLNIELGALGAVFKPDYKKAEIHGEVTAIGDVSKDFWIKAVIYDSEGDIVAGKETIFPADDFQGYDTFKMICINLPSPPSRIRIFPVT